MQYVSVTSTLYKTVLQFTTIAIHTVLERVKRVIIIVKKCCTNNNEIKKGILFISKTSMHLAQN